MGVCCSAPSEDKLKSLAIDSELQSDRKRQNKQCKILLLGSGESGKSTIVKQMKIIHQDGYSHEELANYRPTVYINLLECIGNLIIAMQKFNVYPASLKLREQMQFLVEYEFVPDPYSPIDEKVGEAIASLWNDPCIAKVMSRRQEFYLPDSAPYFFNSAMRIVHPDYLPNTDDILRARTTTTGLYETTFTLRDLEIRMFDVGGQRSERKKWIHCFEGVTAIIFCVALSEYDQTLLEENRQNRMDESLVLFDSVVNSRWFMRTGIVLFLNKYDLLREKVRYSDIADYYPEYTGPKKDAQAGAKFFSAMCMRLNTQQLAIYRHFTTATDTKQLRVVVNSVRDTALQVALHETGII